MPPQQNKNGTITITDDDVVQPDVSWLTAQESMPKPPDSTWWDRANKGLISPDRFLSWATGGQQKSVADLEKERDKPPDPKETSSQAYSRVFHQGFTADLAKTASGLTSRVAAATGALSQAAKLPGLAGKTARAILALQGVGYGIAGAGEAVKGAQEGYATPGGAQKILSGGAQIAGAAPAVAEMSRIAKGTLASVAPQLFAKGESAFVAALAPPAKKVGALRSAYQNRAADLRTSPVKDIPELVEFAEMKRNEVAQELNREMGRIAPQQTLIDHYAAADSIRKRVTKGISLGSPQEAKVMVDYAQRVQDEFFKNPLDLAKADALIIELNRRSSAFDAMNEVQQRQRLAQGDPILAEKALKIELIRQVEAKLTNYKDLRRKWGDWNEIADQAQFRANDIDRKAGNVNYGQRRALESLLSAGGASAGIFHGGGAEGLAGGIGGYLIGRFAADQILTK